MDIPFTLVKRSTYVCFKIEDVLSFDLSKLLTGALDLASKPTLQAIHPLTSSCSELSFEHLTLLAKIPGQWSPLETLDVDSESQRDALLQLATRGLLLTNSESSDLVALREAEEKLDQTNWHPYAAWYHFMTLSEESQARIGASSIDARKNAETEQENSRQFIAKHGLPPAEYEARNTVGPELDLPVTDPEDPFFNLLTARRTVRAFDNSRPLPLGSFSTLLRYSFGCHGVRKLPGGLTLLHKSSPSGGSLHPIDVYVLVISVDELPTGIYHYNSIRHSLEPLQEIQIAAARDLAAAFCNDQSFTREAHALCVLTARWGRNFWKYRRRSRSYGVILTDAGHLSQTFYLLATKLEIGAFYTGAINAATLQTHLGLDPLLESPIGICGCGLHVRSGPDLGLDFEPVTPQRSEP